MSVHTDELERHLEDCEQSKMRHFDFSDITWKKMSRISTINYVVLGLILAWVLSTQFKSIFPESLWLYDVVPVFLALILAGLNAYEAKAGFNRIFEEHLWAARKYHSLWRECKNWKSDFPIEDGKELYFFVKKVRERLNDINNDSPHITIFQQREIDLFRKKAGWSARNTYKVDRFSD